MPVSAAEPRTLQTPRGTLQYLFQRKKIKNINVRIKPNGTVSVSVPMRTPVSTAEQFLCSRADMIFAALERFAALHAACPPMQYQTGDIQHLLGEPLRLVIEPAEQNAVIRSGDTLILRTPHPDSPAEKQKLLDSWLGAQCTQVFSEIMQETARRFSDLPVPAAALRIRRMTSRWGTCHLQKHIVTLNSRLIEAPRRCIEYVAAHEFCHFIHADHSAQFYALLEQKCPGWRADKALLERSVLL